MRLPSVPRALVISTALLTLALAAGGFVLGRSMGAEGTPAAAPLRAAPALDQRDPIVIPERLEIPSA
ncbi:MAG: hypothetical protein JHD16_01115 [Solirubrobacteraceae bacterium]|nr:hypothetical protein [Solirubrobacteraceae bacterium]